MDTKGSPKILASSLSNPLLKKEGVVYIAIKGSLHATDCSVFGAQEEEVRVLAKKYDVGLNGFSIRDNVVEVINLFSKLGYRIISSTGESEITWTMQKEI
ncbi:uncharacterized protein LOC135087846 [Ostrinia nubilalis]|uniref:uncharacterized protein LOC135087846 n=1 Tax=Ostrinia nubilalis TaxID=29057 RepID=UPI0030822C42